MTNTLSQPLLKAQFNPPKLTRATVVAKQMQRTPESRVVFIQPHKAAK